MFGNQQNLTGSNSTWSRVADWLGRRPILILNLCHSILNNIETFDFFKQ